MSHTSLRKMLSREVGGAAVPGSATEDSGRTQSVASVPLEWVGPVLMSGPELEGEFLIPLATYETPLWPSVDRGARVSVLSGGIRAVVVDERMTRSVLLQAPSASDSVTVVAQLKRRFRELCAVVSSTSSYAELLDFHTQLVGDLLFVRFEVKTGDAAGHNMTTKASEALLEWILQEYPQLQYVSVSGNYCADKKATAVNGILGRGRNVIAELNIPRKIVERFLRSTPEKIVDLNIKKNLLGSLVAGGLRTGNAHFANMLLAFYLATGQDAANIVEGSQGFVHAEVRDSNLYFSVTIPHVIVGTVGNGKNLAFVAENLQRLGCVSGLESGASARRLAVLAAASVLCGELSLLAALTNRGELTKTHMRLERSR